MKTTRIIPRTSNIFFQAGKGLLILMTVLTVNSCAYKKIQPRPECPPMATGGFVVVDHTERTVYEVMNEMEVFPDYTGYFDYHDFYSQTITQLAGGKSIYPIAQDVVKYNSTDNNGNPVQLTGLLIYPWSPLKNLNVPIVSVDHGTELLKSIAPSRWKDAPWSKWKDFPEMLIADIMAVYYGWAIIMPDYQGMGGDITENHPYCDNDRLATSTADMMEAAMEYFGCSRNAYVDWNGQAFLYGFSEGGFVTMAAARELEKRDVKLSGVVCMDGPYDLSGTMLDVMLGDKPFPVPYFLPMLMVGYNTMYPDVYDYTGMLKEPYRTDIPKYTTGFYDETVVNGIMPYDKILKKIFTDAFYDSLKNVNSKAYQILYRNNSYLGWIPKSRMLLWHCRNDDCVPFGNFVAAKDRFTTLGLTNIDYVEWPAVSPDPGGGTIHVAVAPRAFYEGSQWIYHQIK
jgi:pimeloyl-ACP methyl ester carboxylesterase